MKHKVKLIRVRGEVVTLSVDGELCSYLIQRPTPLSPMDLRNIMDTRLTEYLTQASDSLRPHSSLLLSLLRDNPWIILGKLFSGVWRRRNRLPTFGESVANYLERIGVEVDIDKKTKGLVILKTDVDKIREEKIDESLC